MSNNLWSENKSQFLTVTFFLHRETMSYDEHYFVDFVTVDFVNHIITKYTEYIDYYYYANSITHFKQLTKQLTK